ncbi:MAG: YbaN family protein [Bacteriovoracaceae bacterium]
MPQVPFAIVSAYFFSKGSPLIHQWMRHNKYFGRSVKDWEDHRVIRPKMKVIGSLSLIVGAVLSHLKFDLKWALMLDVVFLAAIAFILTRKSRRFSFL